MTSIQINPNLHFDDDTTIAGLDDDVHGELTALMQEVVVFEPTSGLTGPGWVLAVDEHERTVTLVVDWPRLRLPEGNVAVRGADASVRNYQVPPPVTAVA